MSGGVRSRQVARVIRCDICEAAYTKVRMRGKELPWGYVMVCAVCIEKGQNILGRIRSERMKHRNRMLSFRKEWRCLRGKKP